MKVEVSYGVRSESGFNLPLGLVCHFSVGPADQPELGHADLGHGQWLQKREKNAIYNLLFIHNINHVCHTLPENYVSYAYIHMYIRI